jgi:hypothetical membrane protein
MARTGSVNGSRLERALLGCGAIGPLLFVTVFLVAGATRSDYDPLRHPVSSLELTGSGWIQAANFVLTGLLLLGFAFGVGLVVRRSGGGRWAALLLGAMALGLIGAGLFRTDPIGGYPPGTPAVPVRTAAGVAHDLLSTVFFLALTAACFVLARRFAAAAQRGWAGYSGATGIAFSAAFVLTGVGFRRLLPALAPIAGLLQRITLVIGLVWLAALAVHLISDPDALTEPDGPSGR